MTISEHVGLKLLISYIPQLIAFFKGFRQTMFF